MWILLIVSVHIGSLCSSVDLLTNNFYAVFGSPWNNLCTSNTHSGSTSLVFSFRVIRAFVSKYFVQFFVASKILEIRCNRV